jgi:hypothetical protein
MQDNLVQRLRDRAYSFKAPDPLVEEAANEIERLWRMVSVLKAAAEAAGFVYRNTDSGPSLVRS